jgi:hypothetical protein
LNQDWKPENLPELINKIHKEIVLQESLVNGALYGHDDYELNNVFAFLTRFLCPGLRAQLFVCGMVRAPSVEVTDFIAMFCFFKP